MAHVTYVCQFVLFASFGLFDFNGRPRSVFFTFGWWYRIPLNTDDKYWFQSMMISFCLYCTIEAVLTNRSSADGPPSGTLMSSLCKSCGTLSNACGPCGKPIGPANDPNEPANVGIGCGVSGICWACICCYTNRNKRMTKQFNILDSFSWLFWIKYTACSLLHGLIIAKD